MKNKSNKRWRLLADFSTQGPICLRIICYWLVCQFACIATMLGLASLDSSSDSIFQDLVGLLPMTFVVSACLLAVALLDALIFTNRFAGPLLNFRRKFAKLAEGEIPEELLFRGGDKYRDIEKNYNKLRTRMQRLEELQRDTGGVDSSLNEITDRKVVSSS